MFSFISYYRWTLSCSNLHVSCICYCRWILSCSNLHVSLLFVIVPTSMVFVIAEFSVVPTSMFSFICYCRWILSCSNLHVSCICYCRWILSFSNLHVFLYLLLQMNSQLFQPPCFLVFVITDELSFVPTSMYSCICYCRWILSCSNLHVFLNIVPTIMLFVIAGEFSVVPTSMFSSICYCRWILSCSNLHVFLYLLLQVMNSQLFQPPCFLVLVIADEFSVVPTSMFSCICYCRWILSCSNLHVFLYLLLQMNSQLFQPPCFLVFVIAGEFSVVPTSMFLLYLLLQMNSQLFQPPCFLVFVIEGELSVVPTSMFSFISYYRWTLICSNLHVFLY